MKFYMTILMTTMLFGCKPPTEDGIYGGSSGLMGVSSAGKTSLSGNIREALQGYTGTVSGGRVEIGGGYGGNGLAGKMNCTIEPGGQLWFSNCNNTTTQGFLPPGRTFSSSGGRSLWSWKESTDRMMRIVSGGDYLSSNSKLSSDSANSTIESEDGEKFEDLMASNDAFFANLDEQPQNQDRFAGEVSESEVIGSANGLSLTSNSARSRPIYEQFSANKLSSLKCQVNRSVTYRDVVEVILRKRTAVMNAYFAKGHGFVGYKYVRQGNGGGTGTNILVCVNPS